MESTQAKQQYARYLSTAASDRTHDVASQWVVSPSEACYTRRGDPELLLVIFFPVALVIIGLFDAFKEDVPIINLLS